METQKFKVGDKVEWAYGGNFEEYKGVNYNYSYYDTGTVVEVNKHVSFCDCFVVRWDSGGAEAEPNVNWIRLLESNEEAEEVKKEEPYISLTKDEVDEFIDSRDSWETETYCSEQELASDFINTLIKFKESKKELSEEQKKIQEALALLENSGYSCTKK